MIGLGIAATRIESLQGRSLPNQNQRREGTQAPELQGIAAWLNSPPLTLAGLRGKVVWIDFWTYSCVNCVRTFPFLRAMYARYHSFGLEIVGVHSPEFDFEKVVPNVRAAVARHRLPYPVALDSDMRTWRAYQNQYWPRVFLIDARGRIRFDHIGEGGDEELQEQVRGLLAETGAALPAAVDLRSELPNARITPEVYAGYERGGAQGALANPEGYDPGSVTDFARVPPEEIEAARADGRFFLEGPWRAEAEYIEAAGPGATVTLPFAARDVFAVLAPAAGGVGARLLLDGVDAPGGALRVERDDLYRLVRLRGVERHVLTLRVDPGFRLYTFTFG
jgi:thiol-disulfide isomerase/thioredoxin